MPTATHEELEASLATSEPQPVDRAGYHRCACTVCKCTTKTNHRTGICFECATGTHETEASAP